MNAQAIRAEVHRFIAERLQAKKDKLSANEIDEHAALNAKFHPPAWLDDAAKRASQIKLVTHSLKAIHPDARGTVVNLAEPFCNDPTLVGTHSLARRTHDVVGNAAALDVFKIELDGETLLAKLMRDDKDAVAALSDNAQEAQALAASFREVASNDGEGIASHTLAKQVYFPVAPDEYHLLAPLFPTALAHSWFEHLQKTREQTKLARDERAAGKHFEPGFRDYPGLAFMSLGGSKPQNISQLNSERGGKVTLLPSGPPQWKEVLVKPPRGESVFDRDFPNRQRVKDLTAELRDFLAAVSHLKSNFEMRDLRATLVNEICDEFMLYVASLYTLPSGWSQKPECLLPVSQRVAFDPLAEHDEDELSRAKDWPERIASAFAAWLNFAIRTDKTPMGENEEREWRLLVRPLLDELADNIEALWHELANTREAT
jgi:CRISPR-associated protein Csy1